MQFKLSLSMPHPATCAVPLHLRSKSISSLTMLLGCQRKDRVRDRVIMGLCIRPIASSLFKLLTPPSQLLAAGTASMYA